MRTGVFFCQVEEHPRLNLDAIAKYSTNLPEVETVENLGLRPRLAVKNIAEKITSKKLIFLQIML